MILVTRFFVGYFFARYHVGDLISVSPLDNMIYLLHSFWDALNCSYGSVVPVCRLVNGIATVSIVFGRSKMALRHPKS